MLESTDGSSSINQLPSPILHNIFGLLGAKDLSCVSATCTLWRRLNRDATSNRIWKTFYTTRWRVSSESDGGSDMCWQTRYGSKMMQGKAWIGKYHHDSLYGHSSSIKSLQLLPSHNLLLTGSTDKTVRLWDLQLGMPICASKPHGGTVRAVALDPTLIASGSTDNIIRLWSAATTSQPSLLHASSSRGSGKAGTATALAAAAASSSGTGGSSQWLFDLTQSPKLLRGHIGPVSSLCLTPSCLYSGSWDYSVRVWRRGLWDCVSVHKYQDWVWSVVARGPNLLVAAGAEVHVHDLQTGQLMRKFQNLHEGHVACLEGTESGRVMFTGGGDGLVLLHDLRMRDPSSIVWHHNAAVQDLAFEDPWLVSASADGMVMMLNTEQGSSSSSSGGTTSRGTSSSTAMASAAAATKGRHSCQLTSRRSFNPSGGSQYCVDISEGWLATGGESSVVRTWDFSAAAELAARAAAAKAARNSRKNRRKGAAGAAAGAGGSGASSTAAAAAGGGGGVSGGHGGHAAGSATGTAAGGGAGKSSWQSHSGRDACERGSGVEEDGNDQGGPGVSSSSRNSVSSSASTRRGHRAPAVFPGGTAAAVAAAFPPHVFSNSPAQYGSSPSGYSSSGYSESPGSRLGSSPMMSPPVYMGGRHSYHQSHHRRQQQQQQQQHRGVANGDTHEGTPPSGCTASHVRSQQYDGFGGSSSSPVRRGLPVGSCTHPRHQQQVQQQNGSSPGGMCGGYNNHHHHQHQQHHPASGGGHWGPRPGSSFPGASAPLPWPVTGSSPRTSTCGAAAAAASHKHRLQNYGNHHNHQQQEHQQRAVSGEDNVGEAQAPPAAAGVSSRGGGGGGGGGTVEEGRAAGLVASAGASSAGEDAGKGEQASSASPADGSRVRGQEGADRAMVRGGDAGRTSGNTDRMVSWQLPNRTRSRGLSNNGSGGSASGSSSGSVVP